MQLGFAVLESWNKIPLSGPDISSDGQKIQSLLPGHVLGSPAATTQVESQSKAAKAIGDPLVSSLLSSFPISLSTLYICWGQ